MVAIAPITSRDKGIPLHVRVDPPEGGLDVPSFVMCDQLRTISTDRLDARRGATGRLSPGLMAEVEDRVRVFFDL
jgi:mRNA interferase MazF